MTSKSSLIYTKQFTDSPQARSVFPSLKQEFPDEGQWNWDAIQRYCESCPPAMRSFLEETSRIQKRYGNQDADYQKAMETFLHHFAFEASIYLHSKEKNYIEDLFDQCAAHPDRTAVVDQNGERRTSYAEFVSLIRKTTSKISSLGLKEHSFIIINMGRCREYPAAMYAVVLSGHALIPLVPETPPDREAYIVTEAESSYTIREDFFDDIDSYAEAEGRMPDADDTAMMLYTSGSTGRPKGVSYSFKMLSFCYQHAMFILEDIDPVIYASSIAYSFAAISVDTFHVFCVGGTMHILSDEVRKDISLMNAYYQKHGITVGNVHPRLHPYLDGGSQLKRIFTSGHRITNFYNESFETYLGYGLAETFSVPTHFCLDRSYASTPVGKPYGGYLVVVCDPEGNELPDGEQGEVRILGDLAQGYFKNPELTAETFEKLSDGTVLLHTHDIGYKDENGDLVLVNRNDMLVKINGMSVNPAEIDYAMSGIPGIRESAAKGFTDANGNSYICDFYASDDDTLTPDVLKEQLGRSLMPYMIPAVFVKMDR
ncbi:MAG: AMP-binding protein, partial [Solobacterium sp.]|nr:AMP-binding protein [Solobacterium sp.]